MIKNRKGGWMIVYNYIIITTILSLIVSNVLHHFMIVKLNKQIAITERSRELDYEYFWWRLCTTPYPKFDDRKTHFPIEELKQD